MHWNSANCTSCVVAQKSACASGKLQTQLCCVPCCPAAACPLTVYAALPSLLAAYCLTIHVALPSPLAVGLTIGAGCIACSKAGADPSNNLFEAASTWFCTPKAITSLTMMTMREPFDPGGQTSTVLPCHSLTALKTARSILMLIL